MTHARLLTLILLTFASVSIQGAESKTNVVLIMADDLGYNDLSCYGSKTINTPILDDLAQQGIRLTSFYSGCTICTPSRMALLTGCYPVRTGWKGGVVGYGLKPNNGLAPQAMTIAEIFKSAGYQTALIGKWHLGDTLELAPDKQGFDYTYFINKSNNQTKQLWRQEEVIEDPFDNRRLTEQFTNEAIQFIVKNRDKPFFLYLPYSAPHFPAQAHPEWKGKSNNAAYGDVVEELDHRIGEILNTLKENALEQNTLFVFISDNGVEPGQKQWARSDPYRGLKWSVLEGGNRVPGIIRWPGEIPSQQVSSAMIGAIDLLPTLAEACDITLPPRSGNQPPIDGVSVLNTLKAHKDRPHPRTSLLFWHGWGTPQAIRTGPWKLYFDETKEHPESKVGPVLFNVEIDPAEKTNVADQHPKRVALMLSDAKKQLAEIKQNSIPLGGPMDPAPKLPKDPRWLGKAN